MSKKISVDEKGRPRFKDSRKLVSRWAAGKKRGRRIGKGEVVHHIDGNPLNNDPRNLRPMSRSAHSRLHARERRKRETGGSLGQVMDWLFGG